jgi:transposase
LSKPARPLPKNVEACHELIEQLQGEMGKMQARIDWLARKLFGRSSERLAAGEPDFFGQPLADEPHPNDNPAPEDPASAAAADAAPDGPTPPAQRPGGRRKLPADLPRRRLVYDIPAAAKVCGECGHDKKLIGQTLTEQLEYIPASMFTIEHVQLKYACPHCQAGVVQAEKPAQPIEKCLAGAGLLAQVIVSKYSDHAPLYRQEAILARHGVELSRSLLCQWAMLSAEALEPVVKAMTAEVLRSHVVATDDTPVDVQTRGEEGPGNHQGRLWVYVGDALRPYTVYDFSWTRGGEHPEKFLGDFGGIVLADAFSGYDRLFRKEGGPTEAGCNAHARRYFFEAQAEHPALAQRVLRLYKKLYAVEREAKQKWPALREPAPDPGALEVAAAGRLELRRRRSRPVMKALKKTLEILQRRGDVLPKSPLGKAIHYGLGHWRALTHFLGDGRIEADNNQSERAIRGICISKKNWMHLGSRRGGRAAAVLFSLVQSARRHGIDPFVYLRDLLTRLPTHPQNRIHELFPDHWKLLTASAAAEMGCAGQPAAMPFAAQSQASVPS